jgi:hypothetical protein
MARTDGLGSARFMTFAVLDRAIHLLYVNVNVNKLGLRESAAATRGRRLAVYPLQALEGQAAAGHDHRQAFDATVARFACREVMLAKLDTAASQ